MLRNQIFEKKLPGVEEAGVQPRVHKSKLEEPHYTNVKEKRKIYECRVNDEKRQEIRAGDVWLFDHNADPDAAPIETTIAERETFKSFADALRGVEIGAVLPGVRTVKEAVTLYESFPGYKAGAEKFGVVRFKLSLSAKA